MILMAHELRTVLQQTITPSRNLNVEAIRPHLLKYASPAGSLKINIRDANGYLIKSSNTLAISAISAVAYFHGVVQFDVDVALKSGVTYIIELASTGYTYGDSAFIGWCNDFDLRCNDVAFDDDSSISAALRMEIWERKYVSRS